MVQTLFKGRGQLKQMVFLFIARRVQQGTGFIKHRQMNDGRMALSERSSFVKHHHININKLFEGATAPNQKALTASSC